MTLDARLTELELLARLERNGSIDFEGRDPRDTEVRVVMHLLAKGLVNDATTLSLNQFTYDVGRHEENWYAKYVEAEQWKAINSLHQRSFVRIQATHAAAMRRAELEQSIQGGRLRDPTGLLFDHRYAARDLQIAVWRASISEPLAVAFLDMNGLTDFNNTHGHDAGDEALRALFEVVADVTAERGDAYRVGGDEIVVVLPRTELKAGADVMRMIIRGVSARLVRGQHISAVAGVTICADPTEDGAAVRKRADLNQYKAKAASKSRLPVRFGALAIEGEQSVEEFEV
jgi:diguanylate cyclase (GGDEF)-like protein